MSLTYTIDIFCDNCNNWTDGMSGGREVTTAKALRLAKRLGYKAYREDGTTKHLCPKCQEYKKKSRNKL